LLPGPFILSALSAYPCLPREDFDTEKPQFIASVGSITGCFIQKDDTESPDAQLRALLRQFY
jgi:hypothetical protein